MLGLSSTSTVHAILIRMERHGLIRREPNIARSIVILNGED